MAIAITLKEYLADRDVDYDIIEHDYTAASMETAEAAHIPGGQLAKSVMLEDGDGRYLLTVIPSTSHVDLGKIHRDYDMHIGLATEGELNEIFNDCDTGAIPPIGNAYGIDVLVDDSLEECSDVYFEAGDHEHLVHLSGSSFHDLMSNAKHGRIARPI
jgi:Ala-tRNA(Pro) deacylase